MNNGPPAPGDLVYANSDFTTAFEQLRLNGPSKFFLHGRKAFGTMTNIEKETPGIVVSVTNLKQVGGPIGFEDRRTCYVIWPHIIGWEYDNMVTHVERP